MSSKTGPVVRGSRGSNAFLGSEVAGGGGPPLYCIQYQTLVMRTVPCHMRNKETSIIFGGMLTRLLDPGTSTLLREGGDLLSQT